MILSQMIFPPKIEPQKRELYYRGQAVYDEGLVISVGKCVSFDTYFNALFYGPYLKHTQVMQVALHIVTSGAFHLALVCVDASNQEHLLAELEVDGVDVHSVFPTIMLNTLPSNGALFLRAEAKCNPGVLHRGWFELPLHTGQKIRVAAVICTYKREEYVYRNLQMVQEQIWDNTMSPVKENIDVFVVDNGKTIHLKETNHIKLFPNKNYGGSGGFTRGLIEAYLRRNLYTHVLFMDDDISFEPETLLRTIQFLKVAKSSESPLCIGGQMLIQDTPTIQFEAGARYVNGRLEANYRGLDLSQRTSLVKNVQPLPSDYNAWWYCCIPVSVVDKYGFPLPLFIKTDDVEYGLRIKPKIVLLNGVGVWHMAFQEKYSPHLEYYIKRNELVVSAIHNSGAGIVASAWKLIRSCGKAILIGNPQKVEYILWAYRDFLKGPDFFLTTDQESLNAELMKAKNRVVKTRLYSILTDPFRLIPVLFQLIVQYSDVCKKYLTRKSELTCVKFWSEHLKIGLVHEE